MATKRPASKNAKAASASAAADPRAPVEPSPAAFQDTLTRLREVVARLPKPEQPRQIDLVNALVHLVFGEGLPCGVGQECVRRIRDEYVDRNEFRVTEAFEVAELLRDLEIPDLFQRCQVVRDCVAQIYNDQNDVKLDFLREATVSDRQAFFNRVPALPPRFVKQLNNLITLEEWVLADKPNQRVVARLGFDQAGEAANSFHDAVRQELAPFGHLPIEVGPDSADGRPRTTPLLSPALLLLRLTPHSKR
ncbi:MAG: hypothetical protein IT458_04310 [Planctomycetes bacterium]|nr:hypothetical protein [Planctomycetota bacterium]